MTRALVTLFALGLVQPGAASPWRGGLVVRRDSLHSSAATGPTLRATAATLGLWVERGDPAGWSARLVLDGGVSGAVDVDGTEIPKTALATATLVAAAAHPIGGGWNARAGIGIARYLYFSPRVIGDSDWEPVLAGEVAYRNQRWWRGEVGLRAQAILDSEPSGTRASLGAGLFVGVGLGR